jgi:hypothetical protein
MSDEPAYGDSTQSVPIACSECNGTGEIREEVKVPADDGEPISRDWAGSVGGVPDEGSGRSLLFFRDEMNDSLAFDLFPRGDGWGVTMYSGGAKVCFWPRPMVTRGDLRRLCAALGVELKEGELMSDKHKGCTRCFSRASKAWYAKTALPSHEGEIEYIYVGMYDLEGGGTSGEFRIGWVELSGRNVPKLVAYDDAWDVMTRFADLFSKMAELDNKNVTPDAFCDILRGLGIKDITATKQE